MQEVRAYPPTLLYLVHAGIHFSRVVMCFVEVAGVTTRLNAFFRTCASQCTGLTSRRATTAPSDLAGGARLLSNSPGTILCTRESVLAAW